MTRSTEQEPFDLAVQVVMALCIGAALWQSGPTLFFGAIALVLVMGIGYELGAARQEVNSNAN